MQVEVQYPLPRRRIDPSMLDRYIPCMRIILHRPIRSPSIYASPFISSCHCAYHATIDLRLDDLIVVIVILARSLSALLQQPNKPDAASSARTTLTLGVISSSTDSSTDSSIASAASASSNRNKGAGKGRGFGGLFGKRSTKGRASTAWACVTIVS